MKLFGRSYGTIDATDVRAHLEGGAVLLDVREAAEWTAGHVQSARHVPLGQLVDRVQELPKTTVITVCRSGHRSASAATFLARNGFEVMNLRGGMRAWQRAGLPIAGRGGRPGTVG
jgi:rhodanese-related sulfurtransferase